MEKIYLNRGSLKKGVCLNIGGGKENSLSVLELLTLLEELTGNKERSIINPMRKADKLVVYLDITKAKKEIDWEPSISFKEGIKKLIEWQNQN